jgi:hypothetical protein
MKFILFVEGYTERNVVAQFLKRWLDPQLQPNVAVKPVRFEGWPEMVKDIPKKALMYLKDPENQDIISVVGLLDLYGPTFYPTSKNTVQERLDWASNEIENKVQHERFKMFFAVHEVEAWLLSQPDIFPREIQKHLQEESKNPENVDFDEPPAKFLDNIFLKVTKRGYKKIVHGSQLFGKLDPNVAYSKCPNLKKMLDYMLMAAESAGCKRIS